MSIIGIYGLQNKLKPDKWYVGQSRNIKKRWWDYRRLKCDGQPRLMQALLKYGASGFSYHILEECQLSDLNSKETCWIETKDSFRNGYNMTPGGDCREGVEIADSTRKKLSDLGKKNVGQRNAMHGKMWITNGKRLSKTIPKGSPIPDGWHAGRYVKNSTRDKIRSKRKLQIISAESYRLRGEKVGKRIWITDGKHNRRVPPTNVLEIGWRHGKTDVDHHYRHTEETKRKIREARAKQIITDDTREKLRLASIEMWKRRRSKISQALTS